MSSSKKQSTGGWLAWLAAVLALLFIAALAITYV